MRYLTLMLMLSTQCVLAETTTESASKDYSDESDEKVKIDESKEDFAPRLKLSGFSDFLGSVAQQKKKVNRLEDDGPRFDIADAAIDIKIEGQKNGLNYGYLTQITPIPDERTINFNYAFFKGEFGEFHIGSAGGVERFMYMGPYSIMSPGTGLDGGLSKLFNFSSGVVAARRLAGDTGKATKISFYTPRVFGFQVGASYTPKTDYVGQGFGGADIAAGNYKQIYIKGLDRPVGRDNLSVGVNFSQEIDKWRFATGFIGLYDKAGFTQRKVHPTLGQLGPQYYPMRNIKGAKSYEVFLKTGYDKFDIAGAFMDSGKSRMPKKIFSTTYDAVNDLKSIRGFDLVEGSYYKVDPRKATAGKMWNVGTSYTFAENVKFSLLWHRTERKPEKLLEYGTFKNFESGEGQTVQYSPVSLNRTTAFTKDKKKKISTDVWTVRGDYYVFDGLKFYGEVDFVSSKTNRLMEKLRELQFKAAGSSNKTVGKNNGSVFMLGTAVNF